MSNEWQPTATAPKDGTIFLVFDKHNGWVSQCQYVVHFIGEAITDKLGPRL